jgi:hypothetical protein
MKSLLRAPKPTHQSASAEQPRFCIAVVVSFLTDESPPRLVLERRRTFPEVTNGEQIAANIAKLPELLGKA